VAAANAAGRWLAAHQAAGGSESDVLVVVAVKLLVQH
jgi:hypothetical protein